MADQMLLLPGMAPDACVCRRLSLAYPGASVVPWIRPLRNETLNGYAARLASRLDAARPLVVCGISFGGIVARELAWRLNAEWCVLISSVRSPGEFPPGLRLLRPVAGRQSDAALRLFGRFAQRIPKPVRSDATVRLSRLSGHSGAWNRWAARAVLRWKPSEQVEQVPVLQIHGSRDRTFPIKYVKADVVIDGGHMIAVTHADEISAAISRRVETTPSV
jgi:pimeloyl-ACP methyl ester carboxylesterase